MTLLWHDLAAYTRARARHYALAVTLSALSLGLLLAIDVPRPLLIVLLLPVTLTAFFAGTGPGLAATLTVMAGALYYLLPPFHRFTAEKAVDSIDVACLFVLGAVVSLLAGALHRAQGRQGAILATLRDSEAKFATFFRANPCGVAITRAADSRFVDVNDTWLQMFGYTYDAVIGRTSIELNLIDDGQREPMIAALKSRGKIENLESELHRKSGETLNALVSLDLIKIGGEEFVLASIIDNSVQKHFADTLRQSHAQLRGFIEQAPIAIAMLNRDLDYLATSRRWTTEFGRGYESLTGRNHRVVNPDLPAAWLQICSDALTGTPHQHDEDLWVQSDGRKRWLRWAILPWREENGEIGGVIISTEDVTEKIVTEKSLRDSWERYRSLFENMLDGFAYCGMIYEDGHAQDFVLLDVNPAFEKLTGLKNVVGRRVTDLVPAIRMIDSELFDICDRVATTGRSERCEIYLESLGFWFAMTVYRPAPLHFIMVFDNVTERKATEAKLDHLAHHDPLTNLPNRALLCTRITRALGLAERNHNKGALLLLDLDHFKVVNDSLGHGVGDELLQSFALRLMDRVRSTDTLARLGGDEFVVLLEDLSSADDAARVAAEIIDQIHFPFDLSNGTRTYAGVSVGISIFPDDGADAETLIQYADTALYKAKEAGRNTYRFYTPSQKDSASERLTMELALRLALEKHEFLLHYQPLIDLPTGRAVGVEALVRWRKADGTMISPGSFIPLAEETGLIVPLGEWVMREACQRMKHWVDANIGLETLAVNLSPRQFRHSNLRDMVQAILIETGLPPHMLELEITEGALMERGSETVDRLDALKGLGVRLAIDDFGTGYSSLAYLKRFPVDKLKVDQSFVRDIPFDPADMEIAATIISMARNLKLEVLAEGIETAGQLEFLTRHQCEIGQGYYFSRPIPADELEKWLVANHRAAPAA